MWRFTGEKCYWGLHYLVAVSTQFDKEPIPNPFIKEGDSVAVIGVRAREKVDKILKEHEVEPLDTYVERGLDDIIQVARRELVSAQ